MKLRYHYIALSAIALSLSLSLGSCSKKEQKEDTEREFALDLGRKVAANKLDSVRLLYPGASSADSLALAFRPALMEIETLGQDRFIIHYTPKAWAKVVRSPDGILSVKESMGLFAFRRDDVEFAKTNGAYDPTLTDVALAARLHDQGFRDYVESHPAVDPDSMLTIESKLVSIPELESDVYQVMVTNHLDQPIAGIDYKAVAVYRADEEYTGNWQEHRDTYSGKQLEPGATVKLGEYNPGSDGSAEFIRAELVWNLTPEQIAEKYLKSDSTPWEAYLKSQQPEGEKE